MKTIIQEISKTSRRISFVHPAKENELIKASKHFTRGQKDEAKAKYESSFRNRARNSFYKERGELITALAETKIVPRMNLVVTLINYGQYFK